MNDFGKNMIFVLILCIPIWSLETHKINYLHFLITPITEYSYHPLAPNMRNYIITPSAFQLR